MHLRKFFSARRNIAPTVSNFVQVVQKWLGTNFVPTKSHRGSTFSEIFGLLYTRGIVVVRLYCGFSLRRQMALQQSAKFRTAFLVFFTSLTKDSVANYASIWTLYSPTVKGLCFIMH